MADIFGKVADAPESLFIVGDIPLDIPPENITISNIANNQSLSFLRNKGSLKIPTGRAMIRIDIKFSLNVDEGYETLDKLSDLVAMSRITPFVPIVNKYVAEHIHDGNNSFQSSYPVAIMGFNCIAGGDAVDILECFMSFIYWNSNPFMGLEKLEWEKLEQTRENIRLEYSRYKDAQSTQEYKYIPASTTIVTWNDVKSYQELVEIYKLNQRKG